MLELVPSNPGPYFGGESLTVDLWLQSDIAFAVDLRGVQLDFQATDGALALTPEFGFDSVFLTTSPGVGLRYTILPALPRPTAFFMPDIGLPTGSLVQLPATERLHVGSIGVQLPDVVGSYAMDALNANEENLFQGGALLTIGSGTLWFARDGALRGESLEFHIVPEPFTVVLLTVGILGRVAHVLWTWGRR